RTAKPSSRGAAATISSTSSPAWELALALAVNCVWIAAAVSGVTKLLPVRVEQVTRLEQAEEKVATLQGRVSQLQAEVERGLDASQAEAEIAARLYHIPPERMQVQLIPELPMAAPSEDSSSPSTPLLLPEVDSNHVAQNASSEAIASSDPLSESRSQPAKPSLAQRWQRVLLGRR
ncbi:MAG: hypothetical protein AAFX40_10800, partial [Cyanobacteria bacterium J06639_1]